MNKAHGMYRLKGIVQHYSWGGYEFIPSILGENNQDQRPFAEYWLGAHPVYPSTVQPGDIPLHRFIEMHPGILGGEAGRKYSSLPYLLKILDVRQMLSIQVHPSKEEAVRGFEAEERSGIPIHAFNRNYRDRNHKPELMVALSDFRLLHGFKNTINMNLIFEAIPELKPLRRIYEEGSYRGLYEYIMHMEQQQVDAMLQPLLDRILPLYNKQELEKDEEDFWAARAATTYCRDGHYDRGIFSIYFFNLVFLRKGEAIFQPPGMPHAYLEGQNIEVMSNSDNVLRAGLTDKHIDVQELMQHTRFEATTPAIISAGTKEMRSFETTAEEFALYQWLGGEGSTLEVATQTMDILLLLEGKALLQSGDEELIMQKGDAVMVTAGHELKISAASDLNLFRVTVPGVQKTNPSE